MRNPLHQPMNPTTDLIMGWVVIVLLLGPIVLGFIGVCLLLADLFLKAL